MVTGYGHRVTTAAPRRPVPPSRARYEADHPAVTVRLDRATKARLDKLREELGASFGDFLKRALGGAAEELEAAAVLAHDDGVEEGRAEWQARLPKWQAALTEARDRVRKLEAARVTFPCVGCGEPIELVAGSLPAAAAVEHLRAQGWGHGRCVRA